MKSTPKISRSVGGLVALLLVGCTAVPATDSAAPISTATDNWATPSPTARETPNPTHPATPAATAASALTVTPSPLTDRVLPGEPWIVYQWGAPCGLGPSEPNAICLVRPDGTGRHELSSPAGSDVLHPDWSPDGEQVTYVVDSSIWVIEADGTNAHALVTNDGLGLDYPAWSPDGSSIAFTRYNGPPTPLGPPSSSAIEVVDIATGARSVAFETSAGELIDQARWSASGEAFVVQLERFDDQGVETGAAIAVLATGSGRPRPITDFDLFATYPDWNRTTGEIVFTTHAVDPAGGHIGMATIKANGNGLTEVEYAGSADMDSNQPSWTPAGDQIMFVQWSERRTALINPDGSDLAILDTFRASHPRLRPLP